MWRTHGTTYEDLQNSSGKPSNSTEKFHLGPTSSLAHLFGIKARRKRGYFLKIALGTVSRDCIYN